MGDQIRLVGTIIGEHSRERDDSKDDRFRGATWAYRVGHTVFWGAICTGFAPGRIVSRGMDDAGHRFYRLQPVLDDSAPSAFREWISEESLTDFDSPEGAAMRSSVKMRKAVESLGLGPVREIPDGFASGGSTDPDQKGA